MTLSSLAPTKKGQPQWLFLNFLHINTCPSSVHSSTQNSLNYPDYITELNLVKTGCGLGEIPVLVARL